MMPDSTDKLTTSRSIQRVRRLDLLSPWNRDQIFSAGFSALCAVAIFVSSFFISGTRTPIGELDPSWQAVLEFAAQKRLQFGSEIIFTYGPLGFAQRVGDSSIDVFNYRQGAALLNDLNYHPRPVIQSYSAYTPGLLRANLDFYRSPSRPSYVLFSLETIDGRFPTLDDALLLPYILANYQPVLAEHNFLLMERTPGQPRNLSYDRVYSASLDIGEKLDLRTWNNSPLFLRVSTTPTLLGRILTLLYQPPAYKLEVELDEGGKKDFRFIRGMASEGFLVNPLLENNADVVDLLSGENQKKVRSVAILPVRGKIAGLKVPITVEVYRSSNFLASSRSENVVGQSAARLQISNVFSATCLREGCCSRPAGNAGGVSWSHGPRARSYGI
jgi:hypothetical protein